MATDIKSRQSKIAAEAGSINIEALAKIDELIGELDEAALSMVAASPEQHRVCELTRNLVNNARHLFNNQIKPLVTPAN